MKLALMCFCIFSLNVSFFLFRKGNNFCNLSNLMAFDIIRVKNKLIDRWHKTQTEIYEKQLYVSWAAVHFRLNSNNSK